MEKRSKAHPQVGMRKPRVGVTDEEGFCDINIKQLPAHVRPERVEVSVFDDDDGGSVVRLVSDKMRELILALPPGYLGRTELELRKIVRPTELIELLRLSFWDEYTIARDNGKQMRLKAVYAHVCTEQYFWTLIKKPIVLAYILQPPGNYMLKLRNLLQMGLARFEEVLKLPLVTRDGGVNAKLIGEIVRIVSLVDNRVRGSVPQKVVVEKTSKNLNLDIQRPAPKSFETITNELKDVESEIRKLTPGVGVTSIFSEVLEEEMGVKSE